MNIRDLSYLETVSEASSIAGGKLNLKLKPLLQPLTRELKDLLNDTKGEDRRALKRGLSELQELLQSS